MVSKAERFKIKERYPYFELGIEHDNTQTDVNQTMKLINWLILLYFAIFLYSGAIFTGGVP